MGEGAEWKEEPYTLLPTGKAEKLAEGSDIAVITIGPYAYRALEAAAGFEGKVSVWNFRFLKPIDEDALEAIASSHSHIITVEDGALKGGLYGAVCEYMAGHGHTIGIEGIGIPDEFISKARQEEERGLCGLNASGIEKRIKNILENIK